LFTRAFDQKVVKNGMILRLADVYTIRDGKAIEMRAFSDRQEALRWGGLNQFK